ncbi:hypothetical protein GJ496_003695 [Pomphorhynchus laevis]|nr:hypothetical protein GJ496_003695 [Pomphorhynchus laevis]
MYCGCFVVVKRCFISLPTIRKGNCYDLYQDCRTLIFTLQTVAFLEVFHAASKITRANAWITFVQILSRNFISWAALYRIENTHDCIGTCIILFAWSLADATRYLFFVLSSSGICPWIIKWLRYSLFVVLYPIGVQGELNILWNATQVLRNPNIRKDMSITMPNMFNVAVDYLYIIRLSIIAYLYFPVMYAHMINRRRSILGYKQNQQRQLSRHTLSKEDKRTFVLFESENISKQRESLNRQKAKSE